MSLQDSDINVQAINIEPTVLIDETSTTEYYVGISRSFSDVNQPNWKIKRIYKNGNVWYSQFPKGDQSFNFIWTSRYGYTYS